MAIELPALVIDTNQEKYYFNTPYFLFYGSLREEEILRNLNLIDKLTYVNTYKLRKFILFEKKHYFAQYTGNEEDFIIVDLYTVKPPYMGIDVININFKLDTYETIHSAYCHYFACVISVKHEDFGNEDILAKIYVTSEINEKINVIHSYDDEEELDNYDFLTYSKI